MGVLTLAIDEVGPKMRVALERARALADVTGAELHVLLVVSPNFGSSGVRPAPLVELFNAERELRRELRDVLSDSLDAGRLRVCSGDFAREVSAAVSRDRAHLVVLADGPLAARRAASIARHTRVPVLVARRERPSGAVVGATDLERRRYPEIRCASELSGWLKAPLVVLHSLPGVRAALVEGDPERAVAEDVFAVTTCRELLEQVVGDVAPSADVLVARSEHPLDAILETERRYQCDLLVVGTRVGGPTFVEPCLAEHVVRQAASSVLVTPVD